MGILLPTPHHNKLKVGVVKKCTPKMVTVNPVGKEYWDRKYPKELLVINDPKISVYILKYSV